MSRCNWLWDRSPRAASSLFLGARPSFVGGAATVLDLFGKYKTYNYARTDFEADLRAMRSDWLMTGQDAWIGLHRVAHEHRDALKVHSGQEVLFDPEEIETR